MDKNTDPAAAETARTMDSPAVDPSTACSPSSTPETDKFTAFMNGADDSTHLVALDLFARKMERNYRQAQLLHAYSNEHRKASDNERMNAEETVARLRARVDDLLKHGKDACEYTDGWEDALLKVRSEFPPENANMEAPNA